MLVIDKSAIESIEETFKAEFSKHCKIQGESKYSAREPFFVEVFNVKGSDSTFVAANMKSLGGELLQFKTKGGDNSLGICTKKIDDNVLGVSYTGLMALKKIMESYDDIVAVEDDGTISYMKSKRNATIKLNVSCEARTLIAKSVDEYLGKAEEMKKDLLCLGTFKDLKGTFKKFVTDDLILAFNYRQQYALITDPYASLVKRFNVSINQEFADEELPDKYNYLRGSALQKMLNSSAEIKFFIKDNPNERVANHILYVEDGGTLREEPSIIYNRMNINHPILNDFKSNHELLHFKSYMGLVQLFKKANTLFKGYCADHKLSPSKYSFMYGIALLNHPELEMTKQFCIVKIDRPNIVCERLPLQIKELEVPPVKDTFLIHVFNIRNLANDMCFVGEYAITPDGFFIHVSNSGTLGETTEKFIENGVEVC